MFHSYCSLLRFLIIINIKMPNRLIFLGLSLLIITVNGAVITTTSTTTTESNPSAREIQPPPSPPTFNYNRHLLGVPGNDFPIFESIPKTKFECVAHMPGYYADMEALCQVFHICQDDGRQDRFLCPNGTLFHQKTFVCEWWYNVDCSTSASHYRLNTIFQHPASPLTPEVDDYAKLGDPASIGDLKVAANTIKPLPAVLSTTAREQNRPLTTTTTTTTVKDDEVKHLKEQTVTEELLSTAPSTLPETQNSPSLSIAEELAQIPNDVIVEDQSGSATERLMIIEEVATDSSITESSVDHQSSNSSSTTKVIIELTSTTTTTESSDINTTPFVIELELTTKADAGEELIESNTLRIETDEEELVTTAKSLIVNEEKVVPKRLKVRTPSNFAYGRKLSKKNSSVK